MTGCLRPVAVPFVAAAPGGVRVRARLRASAEDQAVLRAVGTYLGSLAGKDLAGGAVSVVRGGKALLRVRNNPAAAG